MQLTKDDVEIPGGEGVLEGVRVIRLSKIQQVVEFYEKYKNGGGLQELAEDENLLYEKVCGYIKGHYADYSAFSTIDIDAYNDWLFNHCFVDGLK